MEFLWNATLLFHVHPWPVRRYANRATRFQLEIIVIIKLFYKLPFSLAQDPISFFFFFFFYSLAFHAPIIIIRESSNNGSLETRDWISNFSFNFWSVTVVWKIIRFLRNLSCTTCYVLGMFNASERRFSVLWWLREQESSSFWSILEKFLRESFFLHLTYSTWMTRATNLFIKKWKRVGLHKIKYF